MKMKTATWVVSLATSLGCAPSSPALEDGGGTAATGGSAAGGNSTGGSSTGASDAGGSDSGGSDSGGSDSGGSDAGGAGGGVATLSNNDASCEVTSISAADGEGSHLGAARLTPPAYPFTVSRIKYGLSPSDDICNAGLEHRVDVFVGSAAVPPETPDVLVSATTPATDTPPDRIELDVSPPVTLEQGEHLFVAIEMVADGAERLCVVTCSGPAAAEDRNYWSNATAPPYPWATLASFDLDFNYDITAEGYAE